MAMMMAFDGLDGCGRCLLGVAAWPRWLILGLASAWQPQGVTRARALAASRATHVPCSVNPSACTHVHDQSMSPRHGGVGQPQAAGWPNLPAARAQLVCDGCASHTKRTRSCCLPPFPDGSACSVGKEMLPGCAVQRSMAAERRQCRNRTFQAPMHVLRPAAVAENQKNARSWKGGIGRTYGSDMRPWHACRRMIGPPIRCPACVIAAAACAGLYHLPAGRQLPPGRGGCGWESRDAKGCCTQSVGWGVEYSRIRTCALSDGGFHCPAHVWVSGTDGSSAPNLNATA